MPLPLGTFLLGAGLAAVHLVAGRLRFLRVVPRSQWLSMAGGVSVAYVFVHLLPELAEHQSRVADAVAGAGGALVVSHERFLFVAVLAGFGVFYGLEQAVRRSQGEGTGRTAARPSPGVFWIHVGSFAAYNALVGYLLFHREGDGRWGLLLYATAMALHFLVNDYGLREHHRDAYDRVSRWLLAGAVLVGLVVGYRTRVPAVLLSLLFAFLAGGVVLNVIKEELPEDRESRFWAFALGATVYTVVLLLL